MPFILERTCETITSSAHLVLFGEFLYGLRLNQMGDKYLPVRKSSKDVAVKWYDARGEYSENRTKELKCDFSMERMPSSFFKASAISFRIGCLAYNLFRIFELNGSLYFLLISTHFLVKNTLFQKSIVEFEIIWA